MKQREQEDHAIAEWLSRLLLDSSREDEIYVADWHLGPVVTRPPLFSYLKALWQRRHFILAEARAKAFSSSRNMLLGHAWLILQPLLDISVYGLIFGVLLQTGRGVQYFVGYLVIGVIFFGFMTKALNGGATLIQSNRNIIRAFSFPRAAVALSYQLRNFLDSIPTILITLVALPLVSSFTIISWTWLYVPVLILLQQCFCLGLVLTFARICHRIPDLRNLVRLGTRFWFYGSGVFFSIERFDNHPTIQGVMRQNPGYQFLFSLRTSLLYGEPPPLQTWIVLGSWSFGLLLFGFIFFWRREVEYGQKR